MTDIRFRPVTDGDREFLHTVYASTREDELAVVPWTPEQKAAFLRMQFDAQDKDYHANYGDAQFLVIEVDGRPVGRLYLHRREREFCIIDIALLPEARGAGLGAGILRDILAEAGRAGKPVTIHVERFNRALHLYERLGFQPIEDQGVYRLMRWSPPELVK